MTQTMAAASRAQRLTRADILALALLAAPTLAVFAPAGVAPLAAVAAAAVAAAAFMERRWPRLGSASVLCVLAALIAWGGVSALWSIRSDETLRRALQLGAIFLGGGILLGVAGEVDSPQRRRIALAGAAGIALALAAVAFEVISDNSLRRLVDPGASFNASILNRASTLLVLLVTGPAIWLWREGRVGAAIVLIAGVGLSALALNSLSARVAWTVGVAVAILAWYLPRVAISSLAAVIAGGILLAPVLPRLLSAPDPARAELRHGLPPSAAHRVMVWQYAAGKIAERPLLGAGLDTARSLPDARQVLTWDMGKGADGWRQMTTITLMPLHPHNAPLQLWIELGLPGALLGAGLALLVVVGIARAPLGRADRAGALGLFAAASVVAAISYGAWQSWWLMTLFLAAAGVAALARRA